MGGVLIQASKDAHETSQRQRVKLGWVHGSGQGVRFANKGIMYQTVSHRFPRPWTKQLDAILLFSSILAFQSSYRFLPYMIKVKNNRFPQKNRKKCSKLEKLQIMFFSSKMPKNAKNNFYAKCIQIRALYMSINTRWGNQAPSHVSFDFEYWIEYCSQS